MMQRKYRLGVVVRKTFMVDFLADSEDDARHRANRLPTEIIEEVGVLTDTEVLYLSDIAFGMGIEEVKMTI